MLIIVNNLKRYVCFLMYVLEHFLEPRKDLFIVSFFQQCKVEV